MKCPPNAAIKPINKTHQPIFNSSMDSFKHRNEQTAVSTELLTKVVTHAVTPTLIGPPSGDHTSMLAHSISDVFSVQRQRRRCIAMVGTRKSDN